MVLLGYALIYKCTIIVLETLGSVTELLLIIYDDMFFGIAQFGWILQ